jgi:hypothetical protein
MYLGVTCVEWCPDSTVSIVTRPTGWTTWVWFPAEKGIFRPIRHRVYTIFGAHPAFYPIGTGSSFPARGELERSGQESGYSPPSKCVELNLYPRIRWLSTGTNLPLQITFVRFEWSGNQILLTVVAYGLLFLQTWCKAQRCPRAELSTILFRRIGEWKFTSTHS